MRTQLLTVGEKRAVYIPSALLTALNLGDEVEISLENGHLSIHPLAAPQPRDGWAEAAQQMVASQEDGLLDADLTGQSEFDQNEWNWEGLGEG